MVLLEDLLVSRWVVSIVLLTYIHFLKVWLADGLLVYGFVGRFLLVAWLKDGLLVYGLVG